MHSCRQIGRPKKLNTSCAYYLGPRARYSTPPLCNTNRKFTNSSLFWIRFVHSFVLLLTCSFSGKLKRLNAIFERAADRRSGGIREDKILRILPSGTATKYGIDPAAVRKRLQLRREWQESKRISTAAKADGGRSNRRRRRRSNRDRKHQQQDTSGTGSGEASAAAEQNDDEAAREAVANLGPCPELLVLSRGTFLAMFANETTTFVNTMAQNDRADRERRSARRNNAHSASSRNPGSRGNVFAEPTTPADHRTPFSPSDTGIGVQADNGTSSANHSMAGGILGEMTNHYAPDINPSPSIDTSRPMSSPLGNVNDNALRSDTDREDKAMRRGSRSRSDRRSSENRRRAISSDNNDSRDVGHNYDATYEDDASISSLSTMGTNERRTDGSMDRHKFGHCRTDSTSVGGDSFVDRSLNRSLSHDQEYFVNAFATGNDALSPDSCNSSLAGSYEFSVKSASSFPGTSEDCHNQPQLLSQQPQIAAQHQSPQEAHHSADAAAGGLSAPPRTEVPPADTKMIELQKPKFIERSKSDSSGRSSRRKKKRTGNSGSTRSRHSLDDSGSLGSGSYQSGGKLIRQSKEERRAMRRERRRRKEEKRKAEIQLEWYQRDQTAVSDIRMANTAAHYGRVSASSDSQQYNQPQFLSPVLPNARPPEQRFSTLPEREVYNCEQNTSTRDESEQDCVFFSSIRSLIQKIVPGLAGKKKVLVSAVSTQEADAPLPTQVPNVPGVVLPPSTSQQPMIGLGHLGQPPGGGRHRRAASLTNPASESPAHKFYVRHKRSNSLQQQAQHQLVGIVSLGIAATPPTPDLAGLAFLATPHKPMMAPPVLSSAGSSRSASPLRVDPSMYPQISSAASFSSFSSHSTNGSGTLAGEFVVIA